MEISEANLAKLRNIRQDGYAEGLQDFWESCEPEFAHLQTQRWLRSEAHLRRSYERDFLFLLDWKGLAVADYGIGGAYLGRHLLQAHGIRRYVGVDISERTLQVARRNLAEIADTFELHRVGVDFSTMAVDVFVSIACIQHFPAEGYLADFLANLDQSGIHKVILQFRHSETTKFEPEYPALSCRTNARYLLAALPHYSLGYASSIAANGYQTLGFHHRGAESSFRPHPIPSAAHPKEGAH